MKSAGARRKEELTSAVAAEELTEEQVIEAFAGAVIGGACPVGVCIGTVELKRPQSVFLAQCSYKPQEHYRIATNAEIAADAEKRGVVKTL